MDLHPCMMICNEEYWIYPILRELTSVFSRVVVYDTGSQDRTLEIIKKHFPTVELVEMGLQTPEVLGPLKTEIFKRAGYPVLKVDGDEYYPKHTLEAMRGFEWPEGKALGFTHTRTLGLRDNDQIYRREGKSTDAVFTEVVSWDREYPYEGNSIWGQEEKYFYFDGDWWGLHLHHLERSSLDSITMHRAWKRDHYKPSADYGDVNIKELIPPDDFLREYNPYFRGLGNE